MTLIKLKKLISSFMLEEDLRTHTFQIKMHEEEIADIKTELNNSSLDVEFKNIGRAYFIEIKKINPPPSKQPYNCN